MGKGIYAALGTIALGMAGPAVAQGIPVYDSSGYLQALATVKNTLSMIDQGKEQIAEAKQLYGSFNQVRRQRHRIISFHRCHAPPSAAGSP